MSSIVIIGAQWGDEGKGKVVDFLTEKAHFVVRFQGGNNAGHTVYVDGQKTALKLIPSGILRPDARCLLASGVVLEPYALFDEIESLTKVGVSVTPERLGIADEVTLILPYHKAIDQAREERLAEKKIGTTGKGIGPSYEDAVSRRAIRLSDLDNKARLQELVTRNVEEKNLYLKHVLESSIQFDASQVYDELCSIAPKLLAHKANVSLELHEARKRKETIIFEGAQGCLLDINHGTYPYVTSSNTLAGFAPVSAGIGLNSVDSVVGICKAYVTRVGSGPFPTEDDGADGAQLREVGKEFGTVTGRPRRCGWLDMVAFKRAARLNGVDSIVVTKLDVLSGFATLKIATSYTLDGQEVKDIPSSAEIVERLVPQYEEYPGWEEDITEVRHFSDLPKNAQSYLLRIEEVSGCKLVGFSVGPDRKQTVMENSAGQVYSL